MSLKKVISLGLASMMTMGMIPTITADASVVSEELVWNESLYESTVKKVNDNIPTFAHDKLYNVTSSKYAEKVRIIQEEYLTHPDQEYLLSLGEGVKDFLKADAAGDAIYTSKSLTKNSQYVLYYGDAIQAAIDEANAKGGGTVVISGTGDNSKPTVYYTGALELKSNVELHIEEGAVIKFVRNKTNEYYPMVYTRWEGVEFMNFSPFIYAYEAENIAITGKGALDGQADEFNWMPWKYGYFNETNQKFERDRLFELGKNGADVETERIFTDETSTLRPPFIQPYKSKNILIEGVTINNSPFWEVNPVLCENVKVDGITINSTLYNNDGVDPESSKDVLIENVNFNTGDDCIAIKSGRNNDGRRVNVPSENIVIRNNSFASGHGGVTVGSEISGSVKNVFATDNYFDSEELDYPIRFKTNAERGGVIENIYIKNSTVKKSKKAVIHSDFFYEEGLEGGHTPVLKNVYLSNIKTVEGETIDATNTLYLKGFEHSPIENIVLKDLELNGTKGGAILQNVKGLTYDNVVIDGVKLEDKTINVDNNGNETKGEFVAVKPEAVVVETTEEVTNHKSSSSSSKKKDAGVWDTTLYNKIVSTVNKNTPNFKKAEKFKVTDEEYADLVRTVEEEYLTHPDQDYLMSLDGEYRKDFLKADAKSPKKYTSQSLIKNTQDVEFYGDAIQAAIDDAAKAKKGGTVVIPGSGDNDNPIVYYTGALTLKSNVELHIEEGAMLKFVRNKTNEYYPMVYTRWEGVEFMNFSPLIYAYEAENIAITGDGILDGQADEFNWMPWKYGYFNEDNQKYERNRLFELGQNGADVETERIFTDETSTLRPPFIQPYKCENVLISGVTITNSPFWEVNPVLCENVKVDGITIDTILYNNDGVDPESCKNVLIQNSNFKTGDDCIAIKSGRNNDGRRVNVPSENIVIRNNEFANGHGGVTVGSEISGSVKNVFATDNYFDSESLDYPIRFKTNAERGGVIENIYVKNSTVRKAKKAVVHCDFFYEEGLEGDHTPVLKNIFISNLKTAEGESIDAANTLYLKGFEHSPIQNIVLKDVVLNGTKGGAVLQNVKGLSYKNVSIDGEKVADSIINIDNDGNEY